MAPTAPPLPDPAASTRPRGAHSSHPVVVCCHGPESSEAVQFAGLLAAGTGQPLVVAAAYRYEPAAASARVVSTRGNTSRFNDSDRQVQQAVRSVPDRVEVHRRVVPALSIAAALVELAEEEGACAVVVGRDMHGHVARSVIQGAHCLVVITPYREPLPPATPFRRIGVGLDGSPGSHLALLAAMQLAACVGASVRVIDVGAQSEGADPELAAAAPGVTATFERLDGDPAATLLEATRELDLLICGTRGRGRVLTKVLGSVSAELIEGAHCAVALVPPSVRHRASAPLGLSTAHA